MFVSSWRHNTCTVNVKGNQSTTVNSELFARGLFSRKFVGAKFRKNKPSRNGEINLSFTDVHCW